MTRTNLTGIMQRAHEIARTCEGDYRVRLAIGLRQAWAEYRIIQLGNRWQKGNMDRVYFNDLAAWYGLELDHYKTGNICSAKLNGERISNNSAYKLIGRICNGKVWFDLRTGRFATKDIAEEYAEVIINRIRAAARVA